MITTVLMILMVICIALLGLVGIKYTGNNDGFMNKDYTAVFKGIWCIFVVLVHIPDHLYNPIQDALTCFGYIGVTFYFMVSSFGLRYSVEHKPGYMKHFLKNRLFAALIIPHIVVNVLNFIICLFIDSSQQWGIFFLSKWVRVLLMYYAVFYIVYRFFPPQKEGKRYYGDWVICLFVLLTSIISATTKYKITLLWHYESLGFAYGILLFNYFDKIKAWMMKNNNIKIVISLVLSLAFGVIYMKYKTIPFIGDYIFKITLCIIITMFMFIATQRFKIGNKAVLFMGKISYEVFLLHYVVMGIIDALLPNLESGVYIILTLLGTIALSAAVHSVSAVLTKKIVAINPEFQKISQIFKR